VAFRSHFYLQLGSVKICVIIRILASLLAVDSWLLSNFLLGGFGGILHVASFFASHDGVLVEGVGVRGGSFFFFFFFFCLGGDVFFFWAWQRGGGKVWCVVLGFSHLYLSIAAGFFDPLFLYPSEAGLPLERASSLCHSTGLWRRKKRVWRGNINVRDFYSLQTKKKKIGGLSH